MTDQQALDLENRDANGYTEDDHRRARHLRREAAAVHERADQANERAAKLRREAVELEQRAAAIVPEEYAR